MADYVRVAAVTDVPPGTSAQIRLGERCVALFNVEGSFHALEGVCLHRGGPVGEGDLDGPVVTCPWHGWQYDVTTGANVLDPNVRLATYEVKVEDGDVLVALG